MLPDTRNIEKYAVSRRPGARQADTIDAALSVLSTTPPHSRIVTYCPIGLRSSTLVKGLQSEGIGNKSNLSGSIFKWASEGRQLFRENNLVVQVHPFNSDWGHLLNHNIHSFIIDNRTKFYMDSAHHHAFPMQAPQPTFA